MATDFMPVERQQQILQLVNELGAIRVTDLSERFNVSVMTVRRDLQVLEEQGLLSRSHGGAVSRRRFEREHYFDQKGRWKPEEKAAIGELAAQMVEPGETIFVNSGSTALEFLRSLRPVELRVITSNAGAVNVLQSATVECIVLGGIYRPRSNSFVGGLAIQTLSHVYASRAFLGVDGISIENGLTTPHHQEAEITGEMIRRTRGTVIVIADSSKVGGVAPFVTAPIDVVDVLVTDSGLAEEDQAALEERGIEVILANVDGGPRSRTPSDVAAQGSGAADQVSDGPGMIDSHGKQT